MKKWSIKIKIMFCILFVGLCMLGGVCLYRNSKTEDNKAEKMVVRGEGMWPFYTFESAVDEAATILYGRVVDKSDTKVHEVANVNGQAYYEYYREVSVEVIDILKGNRDDTTITYLEMGGETDEVIYIFDDMEPVEVNGEYVFFLNKYGAFLSPMTLLPVSNGTVLTQGKIVPADETSQSTRSVNVSVKSYLEAIQSELTD